MRNFILRRLLQTLPMLLLASFIIFLLFAKTPGDFIDGNITLTAARAAELKAIYGLDQPLLTRYLHWLGTDFLGRDVYTRLLLAGRISLIIGLLTMVMSVCLGYLLGALSGYVGGLTDKLIMRVADLVMTIPGLPLLIVAGAMLSELDFSPDSRIYMVVVMLSLLEWPRLARLVRGQCLSLRERDFMLATQVLGLSARRRLFGHLLPNTIPILVVMATMAVANAILSESALSYLGLGVVPPTPSWGNMMDAANSLIDFQRRPWLWMPPGIAIFITVIAINVLGDGLRDAMDPNMKPRLK
ncbi:ABC transporter permease subunit [Klebsiella pneumoniae]|uniref:ABC transporter permease subunit n=1 Tax=Klebsiella pneumoniae TaxID=573 RepID=UPI003753240B